MPTLHVPNSLLQLADGYVVLVEAGRHIWQPRAKQVVLCEEVVGCDLLLELIKEGACLLRR